MISTYKKSKSKSRDSPIERRLTFGRDEKNSPNQMFSANGQYKVDYYGAAHDMFAKSQVGAMTEQMYATK
jgi:hypothetical protein